MNVCIDHLRRTGKDRRLQDDLRTSTPTGSLDEGLPEETVRAVRQAIDELPPEQKAIVVLRIFEGLSHEEIAAAVEAPVATVRWRLFRSLEKLESLLEAHGGHRGDRT